jgi:signal transduction histidine kinase/ActR/RegA family two-component response regulator
MTEDIEYHNILKKQIKKLLPESYLNDEVIKGLLKSVSNSYNQFEKATKISDHAFIISEREYQEVNSSLRTENEIKQRSISEIKNAIISLAPDSISYIRDSQEDDLINIIQYLQKQIEKAKEMETQLILSKDIAEKAALTKTHLYTMSHEIRTPMNAVIGFTNLLLQMDPRKEQMEYLNMLKFSAENLLVLINDILDFSKIEAGKIEFEDVDFSVKNLLSNIRFALLPKAEEKGINLKLFIDDELSDTFKGDQVRLGQILTNLVGNAVKFTKEGKVTITVSLAEKHPDYTKVDFEVADTGIGIREDKIANIFESFTQASSDITRQFGGTGLGLTITKRLLELMGSKIKVKSEFGKGSSFYFSLKLKNSRKSAVDVSSAKTHFESKCLKGIKVLIAEDNKINVILAKQYMKLWGVECEVADNGLIAYQMVQNSNYDLVLMDLQMPEMDGYEATVEIRKLSDDKFKNLPIIALTASAMVEIKDQAFAAGMNDYISKPFNPNELHRILSVYAGDSIPAAIL